MENKLERMILIGCVMLLPIVLLGIFRNAVVIDSLKQELQKSSQTINQTIEEKAGDIQKSIEHEAGELKQDIEDN